MQHEYVGQGSISALCDVLGELASRRVFLVTGSRSFEQSGASAAIEPILRNKEVLRFCDFAANPKLPDIERGVKLLQGFDADIVLAVGGGSVLDVAKAINILAKNKGAAADYVRGSKKMECSGVPLVAIPTTSGSGSEATHFAVVYIDGIKYSLADSRMLPKYAIVDSELTYNLLPEVFAPSGADALCQAIEAHWSIHATEESFSFSRDAIVQAWTNLADAVRGQRSARDAMSRAAHLAGKAINIAKTTASHAMSYALTTEFGITHGHAVALTMPRLIVYNSKVTSDDVSDRRGVAHVNHALKEIFTALGARAAEDAAEKFTKQLQEIGLETRLSKLGLSERDIESLVSKMSLERAGNNPRTFGKEAAARILRGAL